MSGANDEFCDRRPRAVTTEDRDARSLRGDRALSETVNFYIGDASFDDLKWLKDRLFAGTRDEVIRHALLRHEARSTDSRRGNATTSRVIKVSLPADLASSLRDDASRGLITMSERLMDALSAFRLSLDPVQSLSIDEASRKKTIVSMVIPVFNEETAIPIFMNAIDAISKTLTNHPTHPITLELLFVNDGSTDGTLDVLVDWRASDPRIRIIDFSRNFGKEAALTAGIEHASGDAVVPIDIDLQDPPDMVIAMVDEWHAGAEVVVARRIRRDEDTNRKRWSAKLFYKLYNSVSPTKLPENVGDFRLIDRAVVEALKSLPENRRFMKGLFAWVGFKSKYLEYERPMRSAGKTKFSGLSLWKLALDGLTGFSVVPLVIWSYIGFVIALCAFGLAAIIFLQKLFFGLNIPGYAALSVAVFFLGGVQIMGIGILGEYLGRVYSEVKRRPVYLIRRFYGDNADG